MNAYGNLAASYDRLTNDVDYSAVVDFYFEILEKENLKPRTAVDLACGTGSVSLLLAKRGLKVTAVDMSEDMLCEAAQKAQGMENPPFFACQLLQELKLLRGVDLAVCALDSLDYITDPADCEMAIRRVYKVLNPGGCFIFDVNTPEKLRAMDGQVFLDEDDDVWQRSFEEHREYAYSAQQLKQYLRDAGFTSIRVYADRRMEDPGENEQRIYIKARKGKIK